MVFYIMELIYDCRWNDVMCDIREEKLLNDLLTSFAKKHLLNLQWSYFKQYGVMPIF